MKGLLKKTTFLFVFLIFLFVILKSITKHKQDEDYISSEQAIILIDTITELLDKKSPYFDINKDKVNQKKDSVIKVVESKESIKIDSLISYNKHILAELGDRHVSIELLKSKKKENKYYLPFALAPFDNDKIIALCQNPKFRYSIYLEKYPFLTEIQNKNVNEFLSKYDVLNKYAPNKSRFSLGVEKMNEFYQINGSFNLGDSVDLKFTNRKGDLDTLISVELVDYKTKWREINKYNIPDKKNHKPFSYLKKSFSNKIEYLKIPKMFDKQENKNFFVWLSEYMDSIKDSNALIIDIRHNSGGTRDVINFFSNYLIHSENFSLANYAKYKGEITDDIEKELNRRGLYSFEYYDDSIRNVLFKYNLLDKQKAIFDFGNKEYSKGYYFLLKNNKRFNNYYYYDRPVYFLINEKTFSSASVFVSSFKGLKNVKIAGIKCDGASGLAKSYKLAGMRFKFSHMLSFQKNGQLFDGVGTDPDIEIGRSIEHILGIEDSQLNTLLSKIYKIKN